MHTILYSDEKGELHNDITFEGIPRAMEDTHGLLWVDFLDEPPELCEPVLINTFHFHKLAVDDALQETHIPKIDNWDQYLYIALRTIAFEANDGELISTPELDVFLGHNYIVTHHDKPVPALERTWKHVQRDIRHLAQGADHILYLILDELAVEFMKVVEKLDVYADLVCGRFFWDEFFPAGVRFYCLDRENHADHHPGRDGHSSFDHVHVHP